MEEAEFTRPGSLPALLAFLRSESAGGLALIAAAAVALVWSNSPYRAGYDALLAVPVGIVAPRGPITLPAAAAVNDALMAVFFLAVALEIRRELTEGALASPSRAAAPALAALGGMVAPALLFVVINHADPATLRGWAVPVATDIAFALAALTVLGRRVPAGLKVFLTALAIIDDLGAIVVIALFYTADLRPLFLAGAAAVWLALWGLGRAGVRALGPFLLGGVLLWALVFRSGLHPTLAGVALAFVVPAGGRDAPAARLEDTLGGMVTWLVLPLFGLANAGLRFDAIPHGALAGPLVLGIVLGLVIGKPVGVFGAMWVGVRLRWARLPSGVTWPVLGGGALLCGIGFTMSLFIGDLAFGAAASGIDTKLAVFAGSIASALGGIAVLAAVCRPGPGRRVGH